MTVIAHPWGRGGPGRAATRRRWRAARRSGWPASRSTTRTTTPTARERLRAIARDLDLVVTGSSDHHGTGKLDHELGCNTTDPEEYERLIALARRPRSAARASRSPRR